MSAAWSASTRGLLASSRGASSSTSASIATKRTHRFRCVCAASFTTSNQSSSMNTARQKPVKNGEPSQPPSTREQAVPSREAASRSTRPDERPVSRGVKGIEYINAERTWGGVPVPLYSSTRYVRPSSATETVTTRSQQAKGSPQNSKSEPVPQPGVLHATEGLWRNDKPLRLLITSLTKLSDSGNLPAVMRTCADIKKRLGEMAEVKMSANDTDAAAVPMTIYPPTNVYDKMLKAFSMHGDVAACNNIIEDMRATGKVIDVDQLDWLLLAAVHSGDHDEVDKVLVQIANLNGQMNSVANKTQQTRDETEVRKPSSSILSTEYMRNWTPTTYRHMLLYCLPTKNLEYALALLGAASQRSKAEAQQSDGTSSRVSFMRLVLTPTSVQHLLQLALDIRQARLAADLAVWMDSGVASRKLDLQSWMAVLRCCAEEDHFPGVALAWNEGVERGMLQPDEGLLLLVLNCASRGKRSAFIKRALDTFERQAPSTFTLQEWHLMPLFEAQCLEHNSEAAMRTATRIALSTESRIRAPPPVRMLGLLRMASAAPHAMVSVYHAFLNVGRAKDADGNGEPSGVTTETMNALLRAANSLGMHDAALKVYGARHYLRNERTPPNARLPKLPRMYADLSRMDETTSNVMLTLDAVRAAEKKSSTDRQDGNDYEDGPTQDKDSLLEPNVHAAMWQGIGLQPDVHSINALLSTAINMKSAVLGRFALDQLIQHKVEADATTYERAIVLAVTQPKYEEAFELLENAKTRSIEPTRDSYRALATRCRQDDDERWTRVVKEMVAYGQWPGRDLSAAFMEAGFPDPSLRPKVRVEY